MNLLTVGEVAAKVRRHPELVRRWLRSGRLRGRRIGWSWLVRPSDVEAFVRSEPERRKR
jgi:excisionase family DNA binding protein